MKMVVFLPLLFLLCCHLSSGSNVRQYTAYRDSAFTGVVFTQNLLFDSLLGSSGACALKCHTSAGCVTFTTTRATSTVMRCRGHSTWMTSQSPTTAAAGTATFFLPDTSVWLEKTCASNADCAARHSECYDGSCLCTPGYYYSHRMNFCVQTCSPSNLQTTFLRYPGAAIDHHNIASIGGTSATQCKELCLQQPTCRTFDFRASDGSCSLQAVTRLDVSPAYWLTVAQYDYNQITCL
ncbi:hypothetical protein BaRGS_00012074 [Batillaria attramentaria]|uniref:Apple domain-containing protein n=1 Tax=Batillaria attramentaria TaxID=370345 RepID=A0ABD0LAW2_9CAEN